MRKLASIGVATALLVGMAPAVAHHSFAMFDNKREHTVTGTIKEFQWTNPHVWIQVSARDSKGKEVVWSVEGSSPNGLRRQGWSRTTFKAGDKVSITMNPLKNGDPGGSFVRAVMPDGSNFGRAQIGAPAR